MVECVCGPDREKSKNQVGVQKRVGGVKEQKGGKKWRKKVNNKVNEEVFGNVGWFCGLVSEGAVIYTFFSFLSFLVFI